MSAASCSQFYWKKRMARRRTEANTTPTHTTRRRWHSPQSTCAYMLWNAYGQRMAATGLVRAPGGSFWKASLLNKLVRTVRAGRPPGVVVSDLAKWK
jgi:hypothetical protein